MKRSIGLWQLAGFAVTSFAGTLLHFLYELTGGALITAPFSGVNESTFEHMKLLFWPAFVFALVQRLYFRDSEAFWCIKLKGIALGLLLIPVIFYTYNGAVGKSPDWLNIAIFFISAAVEFILEARLFSRELVRCRHQRLAFVLLCIIAVAFAVFTFATPKLGIFRDPLTGGYGISG